MTEDDLKRYAEAEVIEMSIGEFRKNPREASKATRSGKRVIVRDEDGSVRMRMSPQFFD